MKKLRKHLYEGMYILNATLSEESRKKALDKILNGITEKDGEIHKIHEQGRMKLAYEIHGKREGFYFLIYFSVPAVSMDEILKEYPLHEDLLRFMTMRTDHVKESLEFKPIKQV
jgi:small subunit ribosomal protein S6